MDTGTFVINSIFYMAYNNFLITFLSILITLSLSFHLIWIREHGLDTVLPWRQFGGDFIWISR